MKAISAEFKTTVLILETKPNHIEATVSVAFTYVLGLLVADILLVQDI